MVKLRETSMPGLAEARRLLEEALARRALVVITARCSAVYEGRGRSRLGEGDRLIIVKPDGAVLLHRPTGYSPVNWQPDSKVIRVATSEGLLVLESIREKPREVLTIKMSSIYHILVVEDMHDTAEFVEFMDEGEIRDYLAEHPEEIEKGLIVIARERPLGDGYADIVARDSNGNYVVIEVKRVAAGAEAVRQLHRYVEALRRQNPDAPVRGILVAPSLARDAQLLLRELGLEYKRVDVKKIFEKARRRKPAAGTRSLLDFLR